MAGLSRSGLARAAGLHANTLRDLDQLDWNPTADTLRKLESYLFESDDTPALVPIEEIIEEARNGRMFILVDDEDRENEGDLIIPAQMATPDAVNFMATHGRGLICLAMTRTRVDQLGLDLMSRSNGTRHETAFTVSIEAREGVTTGISAHDRARTIAVAIDAGKSRDDIVTPGHVFPLVARDGGVLVRAGHTEAAVDVARLAGLNPAGVICEIMKDDGTMARMDDLVAFARLHKLKMGTIRDLIAYRRQHDHLGRKTRRAGLHQPLGRRLESDHLFQQGDGRRDRWRWSKGHIDPAQPTMVRMHTMSMFVDVFGETNERVGPAVALDGNDRRRRARRARADQQADARASSAASSSCAQQGKSAGDPQVEELRDYGVGAQILAELGVQDMVLLTNTHHSLVGLDGYGLSIVGERAIPGTGGE